MILEKSLKLQIEVYVINLKDRTDRLQHIQREFFEKADFNVKYIQVDKFPVGAIGLWSNIIEIVADAKKKESEYIIVCEDDHLFTEAYSPDRLYESIFEAKKQNADILLGGVSWFNDAITMSESLFWLDEFTGLQFTIIFNNFFDTILESKFGPGDVADRKISSLTSKKLVIYPFISVQKDFGYSDVTEVNNVKGYINHLFASSLTTLSRISKVEKFYKETGQKVTAYEQDLNDFVIPTYVINLSKRYDRKEHISKEFAGKNEFDVKIVEACEHSIGAIGLWRSFRKVIKLAIDNDDDVILICEDDHAFTEHYSKEKLIASILTANELGTYLLLGGIGNFGTSVPVSDNLWWVDNFWSTQFVIVFRQFFQQILDEPFSDQVTADGMFSDMTSRKMVTYPFISVQKDFGYSDVCNRDSYRSDDTFRDTSSRFNRLKIINNQSSND